MQTQNDNKSFSIFFYNLQKNDNNKEKKKHLAAVFV